MLRERGAWGRVLGDHRSKGSNGEHREVLGMPMDQKQLPGGAEGCS